MVRIDNKFHIVHLRTREGSLTNYEFKCRRTIIDLLEFGADHLTLRNIISN